MRTAPFSIMPMAAPPCPCANTRGAAAIAVAAAPVVSMVRLIGSIIGAPPVCCYRRALRRRVGRLSHLVLRLRFKITGLMALVQLARRIAPGAVDHASALDARAFGNGIGPALHVLVRVHIEEFAGAIEHALGQTAVPRP